MFSIVLLQIEQNDGMPELLCKECHARLRVAYNFKKKAQYSDEKFRTFITDVNQQFQQVTAVDTKKEVIDDELQIDAELLVYDDIGEACEMINDRSLSNQIDGLDQAINDDGPIAVVDDDAVADDNYGDGPQQMEVLILNESDVDVAGYTIENLEDEDEPPLYEHNEDSMNRELNDAEQLFEEEEHLDDLVCLIRLNPLGKYSFSLYFRCRRMIQMWAKRANRRIPSQRSRKKKQHREDPIRPNEKFIIAKNAIKSSAPELTWHGTWSATMASSHTFATSAATLSHRMGRSSHTW